MPTAPVLSFYPDPAAAKACIGPASLRRVIQLVHGRMPQHCWCLLLKSSLFVCCVVCVCRYMDKGRDCIEQGKLYARLLGALGKAGLRV